MGRGGAEGGVEGQIADLVPLGQARLDVAAAFTVCLGARAAAGLLPRQAVELGVQAARSKLLGAVDLLPTLPPVAFLRCGGYGLGPGFALADVAALRRGVFLA